MEDSKILAIKTTLNTPWWKVISEEFHKKIEELDRKLSAILASSSCIFDEKAYIEVTKISFEKNMLLTFLETPLEVIKRLDVQM